MAPQVKMTEYERQRLENIRRNGEMMAALNLQSRAAELSAASKRQKVETKTYKVDAEKKPKVETPVVMRRSLRTRGLPPDLKGLSNEDSGSPVAVTESPKKNPKVSPRDAGPISMRDAYRGLGSDHAFRETVSRFSESNETGFSSPEGFDKLKGHKGEDLRGSAVGLGGNVKRENDGGDSVDVGLSEGRRYNMAMDEESDGVKGCKQENPFDSKVGGGESFPSIHNIKRENGDKALGSSVLKVENIAKKEESDGAEGCKVETLCDPKRNESDNLPMSLDIVCQGDDKALMDINRLTLNKKNVARVVPGRIMSIKFFPTPNMRMIAVGNKFGNVGFWNMESPEDDDEDGIYLYHTHSGPVSGISIPEFNLSKMFTCCYDGFLRLMDVEKEIFDLVYVTDEAIFSLCQRPDNASCLYFAEGRGGLQFWDERTGKSSSSWDLHEDRINTIDFNPKNPSIMATSSTDGTACIWDLRNIGRGRLKNIRSVDHKKAVHSAYFSPSGSFLATSSFDNSVGIASGTDFEETSVVFHNNKTSRWISSFKAIWGWDDSYIFTGNMKRAVDIISQSRKSIIWRLESPYITAIPCRFAAHPSEVGTLAGATSGGQVYTWTLQ
ncbi:WD repeat-containing protein 76 [Punica granatum]|uniref:WD repeat-containing protein 76 n=1 Tax=Punica granatum TaxID=22663 RepID=A0A6P8C8I8_PUNGR|nr:WD repeat-containing protein 76 [Punica granatum]